MTDVTTNKPLRVLTHGGPWAYIWVPARQLDEVRRLLDNHRVGYTVHELTISMDGGPELAIIFLKEGADPAPVQTLLDSVG